VSSAIKATGQLAPSMSNVTVVSTATNSDAFTNEVDGREGATSPSQIEIYHRDEVENMGCTCKKTNCLKLYCQCFGIQIYCGANCRCKGCFNDEIHEKQRKDAMRNILSRNPLAFDTKFKRTGQGVPIVSSDVPPEKNRILAHKLGCKCRKSNCMKKVRIQI
jgi:Tesmin/TSO1-like CXC domain, cysteine-rich domain